jgi:hypothetical protein
MAVPRHTNSRRRLCRAAACAISTNPSRTYANRRADRTCASTQSPVSACSRASSTRVPSRRGAGSRNGCGCIGRHVVCNDDIDRAGTTAVSHSGSVDRVEQARQIRRFVVRRHDDRKGHRALIRGRSVPQSPSREFHRRVDASPRRFGPESDGERNSNAPRRVQVPWPAQPQHLRIHSKQSPRMECRGFQNAPCHANCTWYMSLSRRVPRRRSHYSS